MSKVVETSNQTLNLEEILTNTCKDILDNRVTFLMSSSNLNKNGDRKLIVLDDDNFSNTIQSCKSVLSPLGAETQESLIYGLTEHFIGELRDNNLVKESARRCSVERSKFNVWFDEKLEEAIKLGLIERHPLKPKMICLVEANHKHSKSDKVGKAFLKVGANVSFYEWFDKVEKVEKIVKS